MLIGISGYIGAGKDTLGLMIDYQLYLRRQPIPGYNFTPMTWEEFQRHSQAISGYNSYDGIKKFAYALKEIVSILTGATMKQLEDSEFKNSNLPAIWDRTLPEAFEWLKLKWAANSSAYLPIYDTEIESLATKLGFKWTRTYREMLQELGTEIFRNQFHPQVWVNALMRKYIPYEVGDESHYLGESINAGLVKRKQHWPTWIITDVRFPDEAKAIKAADGLLIRIDGPEKTSSHPSEVSLDNYKEFDWHVLNLYASGKASKEEGLVAFMDHASSIVNHFNLVEYAGTNIKPQPQTKSRS